MESIEASAVHKLINIEAHIHYGEAPPPGEPEIQPFVCIPRDSRIVVSAPHGTRTFRNSSKEKWHEEDEYTAAMALLLGEQCNASVIANVWRSDASDPNFTPEEKCAYKQHLRDLVQGRSVRWVLDLHGAAEQSDKLGTHFVDLGTRLGKRSMDLRHCDRLHGAIESALGKSTVSTNRFAASNANTITGFCQEQLHVEAVQIEMKPSVRVPLRRIDASSYAKFGPFCASPDRVEDMFGALKRFISYLQYARD